MPHQSLSEVHESVEISKSKKGWRRIAAFFGPAYLVSVGYMDPGNWATDLAGGSQFGYTLIWVLLMSNLMALLLQTLSARLGVVRQLDLAQCNRLCYPKPVNFILYIFAELAIAACDLAEVLGMAIGLQLLLGIPLLVGVCITILDTFLLMYLQRLGIRKMEAFIIGLVGIISVCFLIELVFAQPNMLEVAKGLNPTLPNQAALYIAIGIIGATVMPHNLYLHSALVQTRKIERNEVAIKKALKYNLWDSTIALNIAFFVNAAILILAASTFHTSGNHQVASLSEAHQLLAPILGNKWAPHLFAIALIAAGQSSTITGTLAGQIVMEGYLSLRINPWMRRIATRLIAIVPTLLVLLIAGEAAADRLLVFSQVLLSMQLAFAVIPLLHFVSDKKEMGMFTIKKSTQVIGWIVAGIIVSLNLKLVFATADEWMTNSSSLGIKLLIVCMEVLIVGLLIYTIIYPLIAKKIQSKPFIHPTIDLPNLQTAFNAFHKIAIALDYTDTDRNSITHALRLAPNGTHIVLIHIVESASARLLGNNAHDEETIRDKAILQEYARFFEDRGYSTSAVLGYNKRVQEIVRIVKEMQPDLLILGSHGHKGLHDYLYGETINQVRHLIDIPVFIAKS
jgi:manganese transport protein